MPVLRFEVPQPHLYTVAQAATLEGLRFAGWYPGYVEMRGTSQCELSSCLVLLRRDAPGARVRILRNGAIIRALTLSYNRRAARA